MTITIDTNPGEDGVFSALTSPPRAHLNGVVTRGRLDLGDVAITRDDGRTLLVERKTWLDWAASITDGRYKEQKARFLASADGKTRYIYIIEDAQNRPFDGTTRNMSNKALYAAILKTQLRDGIAVIHSLDPRDTANSIDYLHGQFIKGGLDAGVGEASVLERVGFGGAKRKRDNLDDAQTLFQHMLSVVPGVSSTKARTLVNTYKNISALSHASTEDIANVRDTGVKSRRIGDSIAKRITALF